MKFFQIITKIVIESENVQICVYYFIVRLKQFLDMSEMQLGHGMGGLALLLPVHMIIKMIKMNHKIVLIYVLF